VIIRQEPEQGFADDRLDAAAAPGRPGALDPLKQDVAASAFDERYAPLQKGEPEPQVRVGDAVALVSVVGLCR
jgi:hypothetical protein